MIDDVTIIGGGIVGLATGWQLLRVFPDLHITIVEKESAIATHQTDRNSGVIHSGIYYKPGSAKAINCVKGHAMLLDFCRTYQVPFELCGKVIAANREAQFGVLENIYQRGIANGLNGIARLEREDVLDIEPHCSAIKGIWVPQAGIIDYRMVANQLASLILQRGGRIVTGFEVRWIEEKEDHLVIHSANRQVKTRSGIACAGLYADHIAKMAGLIPPHQIVPFRGEFYSLSEKASKLVNGLIYPVPDVNFPFLGVHLTKRIQGGVEAGPNAVLAFRREGYRHLDIHFGELSEALRYRGFQRLAMKHWQKGLEEMKRSFSKSAFLKSLQELVPELKMEDITRSRTGVRAQALDAQGQMIDDYVIMEQKRMIHILNAPSPAATSCLSIGEFIAGVYQKKDLP
jgi:(S)-2-hydroxyglutarate dehydrogenase